ncbi:MAG: amidohydrolase [Candidatus Latescibacteria bacterium]|jgi:amidohydrolase|nr:amidohydrolase [Candidatus Latescibacterota bacterium]
MGKKERVEALRDEAVAIRRDLHRHPELGFQETRTSGIVADFLNDLGITVKTGIGRTGVVGRLDGSSGGRTVLVRVDIDALPIQEENETDYASTVPGVMHACGHDGHTTIGLMAAKLLTEAPEELPGTVLFAFQPAEEALGGAQAMLDDGLLTDPEPDLALAVHLWNQAPAGKVVVGSGPVLASADTFRIVVRGRGGHGAVPHLSTDVVTAACQIVVAFQTIVSRSVDAMASAVLSVGQIHAGQAVNILPERAEVSGTIRTFETPVRDLVVRRMREIGSGIASALEVEFEMQVDSSVPPTVNDPEVAAQVKQVAVDALGRENVLPDHRTMASEDMSLVLARVPGCYVFLGSAGPEGQEAFPHHHPRFDFDERALLIGAELVARSVIRCCEG